MLEEQKNKKREYENKRGQNMSEEEKNKRREDHRTHCT